MRHLGVQFGGEHQVTLARVDKGAEGQEAGGIHRVTGGSVSAEATSKAATTTTKTSTAAASAAKTSTSTHLFFF